MIYVENLRKEFKKTIKEPGLLGSFKSLFHPKSEKIVAVDPSGGPFIYRGYEVTEDDITIQDIRWEKGVGFVITLTE